MSYHSPRRQPLSLVQNKSNSITTAGSSNHSNNNASPGSSSNSLKKKLPSISAFTSLHTSPKASLETSREGRASLSFLPFTSPSSSSTSETAATATTGTTSGKLRARATTFSSSSLGASINPYVTSSIASTSTATAIRSPQQLLPSTLGPARRTRSKTLSKSITASAASSSRPPNNTNNINHTRKALSQDDRRHSCTFAENDNLQRTLDLLEKHVEEQGRRLSLSSSAASGSASASNAVSPMLSAPLMQRTPSTPMQYHNHTGHGHTASDSSLSWSSHGSQQPMQQLSPPVLLPPFITPVPDLELVYPSTSTTSPSAASTSSSNNTTNSSTGVGQTCPSPPRQAVLSPQVERLSNLINDLSLFLPRADSLSPEQLHAIQSAVDSILGKPSYPSAASTLLGNAIQLRHDNINNIFADDIPTFYVGEPPSLHQAPTYTSTTSSNTTALQPSQTLYDPSTPQEHNNNTDTDMLGASTKSSTSSIASLERNMGGIELQVQHNKNNNNLPSYETPMNYYSFDNDLDLVPPRW